MRVELEIPEGLLAEIEQFQREEYCMRRSDAIRRLLSNSLRRYRQVKQLEGHS
jgi:metal-responsive CopG/Arc/MetJ family transcriptional regulator